MTKLYSAEDLTSRLRHTPGGYAFCVGAGLTAPTVPGVGEALRWMEAALGDSDSDREAVRSATEGKDGGAAYRSGAELLLGRRGQSTLNGVVRAMVLNAHKPTVTALAKGELAEEDFDEDYCEAAEADPDSWYLPAAVASFARLLLEQESGYVLTTNFDPLIEIAIRREGGTAATRALDSDGQLDDLSIGDGVPVVHLHGFWRAADTYHVPAQLERTRVNLQASLEDLLRERTTIVAGYGGWDDVFTGALIDAVRRHRDGELDVLWTFFDSDERAIAARHAELFENAGFVPGRVSFYRGIECGELFDTLLSIDEAEDDAGGEAAAFASPLEGFTAVTEDLLDRQGGLSEAELIRFFDGQVPTWRNAIADSIPRLEAAEEVVAAIDDGERADELSATLVEGSAGEGKSTLLRQAAVDYARRDGWRVLWREPGVESQIDASRLESGSWRWLLVIDEADTVARECEKAMRELHERGRTDVQFLLGARTTDWRSRRAGSFPWHTYGGFRAIHIGGLSEGDAVAVVEAWSGAGDRGLGDLAGEDPEARVSMLLEAARAEAGSAEGSFLGAMLRVRFGEGLEDHVRTLGERIDSKRLDSGRSLLQAFLYVACLHSHNILTLPVEALAAALAIGRDQVQRTVLWPLGEEAALTQAGSHVLVRHRAIAEVAMRLAPEWGEDVGEIYYRIIRGTLHARREGVYVENLADIIYMPSRLLSDDPSVAVRAAQATVDEEPERLSYYVTLVSVLRKADRPQEAIDLARRAYAEHGSMIDGEDGVRPLLYEWGVCAGGMGDHALNGYLALSSVSDLPGGVERQIAPTTRHLRIAIIGLLKSLDGLAEDADGGEWIEAARETVTGLREAVEGGGASDPEVLTGDLVDVAARFVELVEQRSDSVPPAGEMSFNRLKALLPTAPAPSPPTRG